MIWTLFADWAVFNSVAVLFCVGGGDGSQGALFTFLKDDPTLEAVKAAGTGDGESKFFGGGGEGCQVPLLLVKAGTSLKAADKPAELGSIAFFAGTSRGRDVGSQELRNF